MYDGVPGIIASLSANNYVRILGKVVDDFSFAFIAPLGTYYNCVWHVRIEGSIRFSWK